MAEKQDLYIIGAGGVGGHIAYNIDGYSHEFSIKGFFDDDKDKMGTKQFGYDVLGPVSDVKKLQNVSVVIGIAFPVTKEKIYKKLSNNLSVNYPSFIHERAWISEKVSIGKGVIIYPGTTINFGSEINDFAVLNVNCSLGHHTKVGQFTSLAPGVNTGGHTNIGDCVEMGIGSKTLQNIRIGNYSTVGGQGMVIENVPVNTTVAGIPTRTLDDSK